MFGWLFVPLALFLCVSCSEEVPFTQRGTTRFFTQNFNAEFLDILWVVDVRSSMNPIKNPTAGGVANLTTEATQVFRVLDQSAVQYRMGFLTVDMQTRFGQGQLQPAGNPAILNKNTGDVNSRTLNFQRLFSQDLINLRTGGESEGLEAANTSLQGTFSSDPRVPLVLIFISDSNDVSSHSGDNAVEFYTEQLSNLKNGNKDLLRVYSINLKEDGERCTNHKFNFTPKDDENRYFQIAEAFNGSTADLCKVGWASDLDLSGLALRELKTRFKLDVVPVESSIRVTIVRGNESFERSFTFDSATNEIVFAEAPPQGSTIQISFTASRNPRVLTGSW